MQTVKKRLVIHRFLNRAFGERQNHWHSFSWEGDVAKVNRPVMEHFQKNPMSMDAAIAAVQVLQTIRPDESFKIVTETVTVEEIDAMTFHAIKPRTVEDLKKIALNPPDHDGVRVFNALAPVIAQVNLNPVKPGAHHPRMVLHAIETMDAPRDEWVLVDCRFEAWSCYREYVNLAQKATIKLDSGIGSYVFERHDHVSGSYETFKTFRAAANRNQKQRGYQKWKASPDRKSEYCGPCYFDVEHLIPKDIVLI